jgi:antitoxin (DNA-binding transcriptional repressor) of toxin-antitoxin stability system
VKTVTIHVAKTTLSRLIADVEAGEEIIIHRGRHPVARLVPITAPRPPRAPGRWKGMFVLPESFFEPLPDEELRQWEGEDDEAI